ncbi:MAG: hypothetical protein HZC10_00365 [Nitrospirae bacterium]|nr:hypothetical protein [Nitrospirota bacterium]
MFNRNRGYPIVIAIILVLILSVAIYGNAVAEDGISKERQGSFEEVIQPWIKGWFIDHAVEISHTDNVKVERRLVSSTLYRFENIDEQERYSVSVIYHVVILDRPSNIIIQGLKEQQIIFLLKGNDVIDYFPFDEYWKENILIIQ